MPASDYPMFRLSDTSGNAVDPGGGAKAYALLRAATATGTTHGPVRGGDYVWTVEGTVAPATVTLQRQKVDGTWTGFTPAASLTAEGQVEVGVGQGSLVRALVTGTPGGALNSDLSGLS